jgi:hypothetical protein
MSEAENRTGPATKKVFGIELHELTALVAEMRALGVTKAFGVELGPAPHLPPPPERPLTPEEKKEARIAEARDEMRARLFATGKEYTDEQIDRLLDPEVFEG